jgi:hypothetical protein
LKMNLTQKRRSDKMKKLIIANLAIAVILVAGSAYACDGKKGSSTKANLKQTSAVKADYASTSTEPQAKATDASAKTYRGVSDATTAEASTISKSACGAAKNAGKASVQEKSNPVREAKAVNAGYDCPVLSGCPAPCVKPQGDIKSTAENPVSTPKSEATEMALKDNQASQK